MKLTILCIGDVVGRPGRSAVAEGVPRLVKERGVDCVIANVENAANGSGLTEALYDKFLRYGVHLMTLGDHIYRRAEILPVLEKSDCIVRPVNYPPDSIGKEIAVYETEKGPKVAVISVMGRLFMKPPCDCPYKAMDRALARVPQDVRLVIVDMHAEATSEKIAMGWHLNGRVTAMYGTHTHVPTADERVLDRGTAYITDLGMTGPYDGVLGRRKDRVLRAFVTGMPSPFDVASDDVRMCGVLIEADSDTGRATSIERVSLGTVDSQ
ncbi:MAG TPA: TIGR00282 family metallophosphoesterase [Phycisphaerae bacterium]|nr:TIGR00282 family metallophosphoesterase [Phycisphaerae bacterium]HRW54552.1 TIGR00282 family metallophosphoesterase [Phycisphaerae bacterium]